MSKQVKLSSKLAADEECNGLDSLADSLRDDPDQVIVAITWLTVPNTIVDNVAHTSTPVVQIARIEPISTAAKAPAEVIKLASELYEKRLSKPALPFDVTATIHGGYVNPDTGEREDMDA
jgi:hypothetical protein